MSGNEWWGRLGLSEPEGGKGQEVTEPAAANIPADEGGRVQEITDPVEAGVTETNTESVSNGGNSDDAGAVAQGANDTSEGGSQTEQKPKETNEKKPQTEAERREQAKLRREREKAELEASIRKEEADKRDAQVKRILSALGVKDSANGGKAVESYEEFEKLQARQRTAQMQRDLKAGKLTPETLGTAVLETPEIKEVLQAAKDAKAAAEEAQGKAKLAQFNANMQTELAEIRKLNPNIQSTDDIVRMETGPEFARLVRTGLRPSEAYKLANFEQLQSSARNAAEQAARNAAAGKAHMQPTPAKGQAQVSVPEDYKQNMRRYNKGITDAEIAKYYAKYQQERS